MFNRMVGAIRRYNNANRTVRELSRLSDRELNDLGISRSEIRNVATRAVA